MSKSQSLSEDLTNSLNLLFYREGFSYYLPDELSKVAKISSFKVSHPNRWETEITKELDVNLRLRRNFSSVRVGLVSTFFNLVPNVYLRSNPDDLLNFSEAEFENNILFEGNTSFDCSFLYGTSQLLVDKLKELYGTVLYFHSGQIFLDSVQKQSELTVHLNLIQHNLEIAVTDQSGLQLYNLFETPTGEDILFYTLFALQQLELDSNRVEVKCYGQLLPNTKVFQTLKKYVRNVNIGLKDERTLENFTLINISKCA